MEHFNGEDGLSDWLCRLAAHEGYGARSDWQRLCGDRAPVRDDDGGTT